MKIEKKYIAFIIFVLLFSLTGCKDTNTNDNTVSVNRVSTEVTINTTTNNMSNDNSNTTTNNITEIRIPEHEVKSNEEVELSSFSTKLGGKDTPRSRNIGITTSILNETIIKNGETFSFCGIVGKPTADRGYEEADSFDTNGKTVKTYGGGNCQVSSTIYNAVLAVNELEVTERHAHIKPVHYVEKDKDATVAYGSVDFKFKNNTGSDIKLYANSDLNSVNVRIVKM